MTDKKTGEILQMTTKKVWHMPLLHYGFGGKQKGTMKKMLGLVTGAVIALTLAACSDNPGSNTPSAAITLASPSAATVAAITPSTTVAAPLATQSPITVASTSTTATLATAAASPAAVTSIKITIGDRIITAVLNESAAAKDFAASLPVTLPASRIGGIEYMMELPAPLTETGPFYTSVRAGHIVYWNPRNSVTIIYAPTSSVSELTKLGEITSDLSVFANLPTNVDIRIEVS